MGASLRGTRADPAPVPGWTLAQCRARVCSRRRPAPAKFGWFPCAGGPPIGGCPSTGSLPGSDREADVSAQRHRDAGTTANEGRVTMAVIEVSSLAKAYGAQQ